MTFGLTRRQSDLLAYLRRRASETPVSPSYDEMTAALGLKSKAGVHRIITGLEERGFIQRLPFRARSIVLTERAA